MPDRSLAEGMPRSVASGHAPLLGSRPASRGLVWQRVRIRARTCVVWCKLKSPLRAMSACGYHLQVRLWMAMPGSLVFTPQSCPTGGVCAVAKEGSQGACVLQRATFVDFTVFGG